LLLSQVILRLLALPRLLAGSLQMHIIIIFVVIDSAWLCCCCVVLLPHDQAAREIVKGGEELGLDGFGVLLLHLFLLFLLLRIDNISASVLLCGIVLFFAYKCVVNILILQSI
jgi:hypothetical protein